MVKLDFPSLLFLAKQCLLKAFLGFISMKKGCLVPPFPHNIIKMTFKPHDKSIFPHKTYNGNFCLLVLYFNPEEILFSNMPFVDGKWK